MELPILILPPLLVFSPTSSSGLFWYVGDNLPTGQAHVNKLNIIAWSVTHKREKDTYISACEPQAKEKKIKETLN